MQVRPKGFKVAIYLRWSDKRVLYRKQMIHNLIHPFEKVRIEEDRD